MFLEKSLSRGRRCKKRGRWCNPAVMLFLKPRSHAAANDVVKQQTASAKSWLYHITMPSFKLQLRQATRNGAVSGGSFRPC